MESNACALEVINPMLVVSNVFAMFPPYHFSSNIQERSLKHKIYCIIVLVTLVSLYVYQTYARFTSKVYETMPVVAQLIDGITSLILMLSSFRIIGLTITRNEDLKSLVYDLERFDDSIRQYSSRKIMFTIFYSCAYVLLISTIVTGVVVTDNDTYKYQIVTTVLLYQHCLAMFMIYGFDIEILLRYHTLNKMFTEIVASQRNDMFWTVGANDTPIFIKVKPLVQSKDILKIEAHRLKKIGVWHNDLCKVLEQYNDLFGSNLLLFVLFEIADILNNTVKILSFTVFNRDEGHGSNIVYFAAVMICVSLFRTLLNAIVGDILEAEANRLTKISNRMLNDIPVIPETDYDKILREQLQLIAHQVHSRKPCVSTGFFIVNLKMMGSIATSITAYIIVVFQFLSR